MAGLPAHDASQLRWKLIESPIQATSTMNPIARNKIVMSEPILLSVIRTFLF
jgi:hypothetical protein